MRFVITNESLDDYNIEHNHHYIIWISESGNIRTATRIINEHPLIPAYREILEDKSVYTDQCYLVRRIVLVLFASLVLL